MSRVSAPVPVFHTFQYTNLHCKVYNESTGTCTGFSHLSSMGTHTVINDTEVREYKYGCL